MPNRLSSETSPYLLQHAHNPVDWYPWGEEALAKAREEDKPILLSVGYAACHWCHVMERESFENSDIARLMNELFVNIKVDREERPDIDTVYMEAVQAMTGSGGWPLTVFLMPEGSPFFGGTYFPAQDRPGLPGFPRVLLAVAEAYRKKRTEITQIGEQVISHVKQGLQTLPGKEMLTPDILEQAYQGVKGIFDHESGGFGGAPKFPQPVIMEFLLRCYHRSRDRQPLEMLELTLGKMAGGGIRDQVGGGFHRYAVDARWLVPHFEKMLYDNALLSRLYLHAYQATGNHFYRGIAEDTLDYVLREMTSPDGGHYASQDADSEGVEGKYYVWTPGEINEVFGKKQGEIICQYFGVTEKGNFEGKNVLHVSRIIGDPASDPGMGVVDVENTIQQVRKELLTYRARRSAPSRDEKVMTSWNGLMLRSFAEAASILGREDYCKAAVDNATFLLRGMMPGGKLMHIYKDGQARIPAYLEDYAFLVEGLLAVHTASMQRLWLDEACCLTESMLEIFWDEAEGAFYDSGPDHENLPLRARRLFDSPVPSGNAAAVNVLLHMAIITGKEQYREIAVKAMSGIQGQMSELPSAFGAWLCALDYHLADIKEIVVIGDAVDHRTKELLATVQANYLPHKVVLAMEPDEITGAVGIPLLEGRALKEGKPTTYVCREYVCQGPTTEPEKLKVQLES